MRPHRNRICVLSDQEDLSAALAEALSDQNFLQEQMTDLASARAALSRAKPHLLILEIDSWTKAISNLMWTLAENPAFAMTRKIVLCGQATADDKIEALEVGADYFLSTPVSSRVIRASLNALFRSNSGGGEEQVLISVGDLTIDRTDMRLTANGTPVPLTVTEFNLVEFLALRAGHVVTRQELLQNLWPEHKSEHDTRLVEVYIHRLRSKIEIDPSSPQRLLQFRGKGYTLVDPDSTSMSVETNS